MSQRNVNFTPLTADFCHRTEQRFVFEPETVHEAEFIAQQLLNMGFRYYKSEYAAELNTAVAGCIYLDTDNTIMISSDKRDDGLFCSVNDLPNFYIPKNVALGPARLGEKDVQTRTLVFYPRTAHEVRGIFDALTAKGAVLADEDTPPPVFNAMSVTQGMFVKNGKIHYAPQKADLIGAEICTAADLGVSAVAALSPEQITMMAAFNEMTARMQQMADRIEQLENEILPQKVEKRRTPPTATFPKPGG